MIWMKHAYYILLPIQVLVVHAKEWLTLLNGELGEQRTCPNPKDFPCDDGSCQKTWERILQFFRRPLIVSWHACTHASIASLLAGAMLFS